MKIPAIPPNFDDLFKQVTANADAFLKLVDSSSAVDYKGRYLHWDKIRYLETNLPDERITKEFFWFGIKFARRKLFKELPFIDGNGKHFAHCMHNEIWEKLHWLDLHTAGTIKSDSPITNPHTKSTYLIRSLIDEAISSSQLEGASTTRHVAKEMIRQERKPKDKSEQMIFNNYRAMQFIKENKNEKLTIDMICELHRIVVDKTLDDSMCGEFRTEKDRVDVIDQTDGEILHTPPPASTLNDRLALLCKFANDELETEFIHPIIKAIILHFMLAYEHPFVDGNGRTARALFYWSIAKQGYWLMEFISISKIIHKAPIQYGKAFLYTETDDNDITYFIDHQLKVIEESVADLFDYLNNKMDDIRKAELLLKDTNLQSKLNFRQLSILRHALKHPRYLYNIKEHQSTHSITYQTARKDLLTMSEEMGLLIKLKMEKTFVFMSPENLGDIIKDKE